MSEKKHIDRLFQEKFKDFEVSPEDKVWDNIEAKLKEKKKKRRIIPIWWRYAGIAALLLLLISVGVNYFNSSVNEFNIPENTIVNQNPENAEENNQDVNTKKTSSEKETIKIASSPNSKDVLANDKNTKQEINVPNNAKNSTESSSNIINKESKTAIAKSVETPEDNAQINKEKLKETINKKTDVIAKSTENIDNTQDNLIDSKLNNIPSDNATIDISKTDEVLNNIKNETNTAVTAKENVDSDALQDLSKENTELTIEDALEQTKDIIEEEKLNRWSVAPNVAPVYYSSFGTGSHIDDQFINNSKSGELNTSYGINFSYALNNNLKIRSGIHKVILSYDTNNVILFQNADNSISTNLLKNLSQIKNITISSNAQSIAALGTENVGALQVDAVFKSNFNAAISQRIDYFEIPIEIQYDLIAQNNNFGLNIIGGFSTFLLNNNEVFSEFDERKTFIGTANNINDFSFSANFGVGLNYSFSEKFKFNLEPIFKYQINAYNNTSGDFNPYIIGIYTGFSLKF